MTDDLELLITRAADLLSKGVSASACQVALIKQGQPPSLVYLTVQAAVLLTGYRKTHP